MKTSLLCSFFLAMIFSCITKSRYQKTADEIAAKMPPSHNMNVGKEKYNLYVPTGWTTKHQTAYGMDFYYLLAPKTADNPNTNINVMTEYMQNLSLQEYLQKGIESVVQGIPSSQILGRGQSRPMIVCRAPGTLILWNLKRFHQHLSPIFFLKTVLPM
jgi:hypothetical protein